MASTMSLYELQMAVGLQNAARLMILKSKLQEQGKIRQAETQSLAVRKEEKAQ